MRTAIIGGGAAGFFLAVNLKEKQPDMQVDLLEAGAKVLRKVKVSGGGRCNCTNTFEGVDNLQKVYPRGFRLMKRLFNVFDYKDVYEWFEKHGVPLVVQPDGCVFPEAQDSQAIINCLYGNAVRLGVNVVLGRRVRDYSEVSGYDFVAVTTGGSSSSDALSWIERLGHKTEKPLPSLFSFSVKEKSLNSLMGLVVESASVRIAGTKPLADGALLITHWGFSGPAILRLSSYNAVALAENDYSMPLVVNWLSMNDEEVMAMLTRMKNDNPRKQVVNTHPECLPTRLWEYLVQRALGGDNGKRWCELGKKELNRVVCVLSNDNYKISGRAPFRDEFVTCGGVSLSSVNSSTLESRHVENLYFAGEVLDIDGVTGGFNFQAAWTTAYKVAESIAEKCASR